mmetsp:Transcript_55354/g.159143  ORF Transcript_55354/g.159143 Transcript_55354/m.159143 type:complete len:276 (-) Transcript_55354:85-912(-)
MPEPSGYDFSKAKVAIVTGGGSGIGRAICLSLARRGVATVVAADIDTEGAAETVRQVEALCLGVRGLVLRADVGSQAGVDKLVDEVEAAAGPVDAFFANAGIAGDHFGLEAATPEIWERMMAINVYQSVYAAKRLLPDLARRGSCFAVTSSAAGLLMQMGTVAYTVTKHAARSLAEWLAVTYGDAGLHVACLCPQAVASKMTAGGTGVAGLDGMIPAEAASESLMKALEAGTFLALPHPQVGDYVKRKAENIDRWLAGMRRSQAKVLAPMLKSQL